MGQPRAPDLAPVVLAELKRQGRPWTLVRGTKHWKLLVDGRLAAVMGYNRDHVAAKRQDLNTVRAIRRVIREGEL